VTALVAVAVGGSLLAGALVAARIRLPERIAALVTTFGGGILLAAIALELVPEADERAGATATALAFLAGAFAYVLADRLFAESGDMEAVRRSGHAAAAGRQLAISPAAAEKSRGEAIAAGLVLDGIPESIALGLTVAEGEVGLALLVGIVVGNVVEAYGAAQPMLAGGRTAGFAVGLLGGIGLVLAGASALGAVVEVGDTPVGIAEAVAAGAVLAVVSISVIPHSFHEVNRWVAAAASLGFVAGYVLS
jgi:zinc transporter, ZIP family